ncbi:hypothetical protein XENTR_v10004047 [Xenopus tropicalis]|nr:hypothetical protein XENTR_v10004047 [Xenopus tropicalis]
MVLHITEKSPYSDHFWPGQKYSIPYLPYVPCPNLQSPTSILKSHSCCLPPVSVITGSRDQTVPSHLTLYKVLNLQLPGEKH